MDKVKIKEIADESGLTSGELLSKAQELGLSVEAAERTISYENACILVEYAISGVLPTGFKKPVNRPHIKAKKKPVNRPHIKAKKKPVNRPHIKVVKKQAWITETGDQYDERMKSIREEVERKERERREERNRKRRERYRLKKIEEEERQKQEQALMIHREEERQKQEQALMIHRENKEKLEAYKENEYRQKREILDEKLSPEYKEFMSNNIDTSSLCNLNLSYEERTEIIEFCKLCASTQPPELKRKFVTVTKYITDHSLWDRFPTIRAKLTFSGGSSHKGISPKYYRIIMNILGSETCNTGTHVISSESF